MVSRVSKSSPEPNIPLEVLMEMGYGSLISKIKQMKMEIEADRVKQIREKLAMSGKKLLSHINQLSATFAETAKNSSSEVSKLGVENAICMLDGCHLGSDDKDFANIHEAAFSKSVEFPKVQRIPSYTTWIFLHRNQKMAEDQTVVGRRRIYYDQSGNEALVCTDSDDDMAEMEEEKREFSEGEDRILWMAFREHGFSEEVAELVSHFIGGTSSEILERGNELELKFKASCDQGSAGRDMTLEKSLSAALDSFDNLFCRRCLVFDCRLHGCSQSLIYPSEKQSSGSEPEDKKPCSDQCYLLVGQSSNNSVEGSESGVSVEDFSAGRSMCSAVLSSKQNKSSNNAVTLSETLEVSPGNAANLPVVGHTVVGKRKTFDDKTEDLESLNKSKDLLDKKLKKIHASDSTTDASAEEITMGTTTETFSDISLHGISSITTCGSVRDKVNARLELERPSTLEERRKRVSSGCNWKPLEKDLYTKGLEIFGRNSCLIARNLLSGLKTCAEVSSYMHNTRATHKRDTAHSSEDSARSEPDPTEQVVLVRPRTRIFRKKGRARRLKYSSKSNGHPSSWKRIGNGNQSCKQYTPCSCEFMCGKDCSCLLNGTCCEKYCGCSKSCKNRFRGCHCAKSQCRSRQCPCYAAGRECDPDVCRNCWVSCGGGSLGEPDKKGDGQCENMKLLLRQQKRVLLGRSDVAGWGAFINKTVNKNEYLGEYTGELVSHREADKRGKIYDRANSSFLFDLNDQYVLDACRQGDKLKFANHSSKPNCFCKVMLVAGDHRVGIFAKERIEAKEELFYDYRYGPDQAPAWARKPGTSKKGDPLVPAGRARKHQ